MEVINKVENFNLKFKVNLDSRFIIVEMKEIKKWKL